MSVIATTTVSMSPRSTMDAICSTVNIRSSVLPPR
jgi:hypothetical protein